MRHPTDALTGGKLCHFLLFRCSGVVIRCFVMHWQRAFHVRLDNSVQTSYSPSAVEPILPSNTHHPTFALGSGVDEDLSALLERRQVPLVSDVTITYTGRSLIVQELQDLVVETEASLFELNATHSVRLCSLSREIRLCRCGSVFCMPWVVVLLKVAGRVPMQTNR